MKSIVLIACSKTKANYSCVAAELYTSPLFSMSLTYAKKLNPSHIFVLSAHYGLIALNVPVSPYNKTLADMPNSQKREWSRRIIEQLNEVSSLQDDQYVILAGQDYYKYLLPHFGHYSLPFKHLGLGKRLAFLKNHI